MPFFDRRVFDIKPGQPLPRVIHSFLGRRLKILPEEILYRGEFAAQIKTAQSLKATQASSPLLELVDFEEEQELLNLKNQGATHVVRVHKIDFV